MTHIPYEAAKRQFGHKVTASVRGAFGMGDQPTELMGNFLGYYHQQDPTTFARDNLLTYPSVNCFIPFRDKIVPRLGTTLLGSSFTQDTGIIGHMKKYGTASGIEVEIRVTQSNGSSKGDIIEILCPDFVSGMVQDTYSWRQITLNTNSITPAKHEYYFSQWFDTDINPAQSLNLPRAIWVNGNTSISSWTGGIAPIVSFVPGVSITTTPGKTWAQLGFVDPAFDSTLNGTITINGVAYIVTGGWETSTLLVSSTAGIAVNDVAFSEIQVNDTPLNVSGTITHGAVSGGPFVRSEKVTGGTSGATGFITLDNAGVMFLYGIQGTFTGGETIIGSTSQATTVVSTYTETNVTQLSFDVCKQNSGYMYYGSWDSMQLFQSNQFSKDPTLRITNVQAVQNDLVLGTTQYTGTGQNVYRVTIDSVSPDINTQIFVGTGNNDGRFLGTGNVQLPAGYTGTPGVENHYKISVVANYTIVIPTPTPQFEVGEFIIGATPGDVARLVYILPNGGNSELALQIYSGVFAGGDTITGQDSGATATIPTSGFSTFWQNWVQYFKNGVLTTFSSSSQTGTTLPIFTNLTLTLSDGIIIVFGGYTGHEIGDYYELDIRQGGKDTFQWQINGGVPNATHVSITGGVQNLNDGVSISFVNKNGHTLGDYWDITATQGVGGINPTIYNQQAFANFYYTLPIRSPGEGYIYQLPANFWAMEPQEGDLYVCNNYGNWSYVNTQLAADLLSETIAIVPLKQTGSSKPIYPYMIGHLDNDLVYVTNNKTLDLIGRKELIELPRISTLSYPVQKDFDVSTFTGGSIEYWNKTLWITSPKEVVMFCYDNHPENLYWQPPQIIPENGILSVITRNGTDFLISHSQLRNQSWTLFNGKDGDNGIEYLVQARTPYFSNGNRWGKKSANKMFIEGYVEGNPPIVQTLLKEINGCGGIVSHIVEPVICVGESKAPFGMNFFGATPHASDIFVLNNYFKEIYPFQQTQNFYFSAIQVSCRTTNHTYELLSFGINSIISTSGTNEFLNKQEILSI